MLRYLVGRVLGGIGTLLGLSAIVFIFLLLIPGSVVANILGPEGSSSPEAVARLEKEFGLDRPVAVQYLDWLAGAARGDLGDSWRTRLPVSQTILERLPLTAELTVLASLIAVVVGVPLGAIGASRHGRLADHATRVAVLIGSAIPVFLTASLVLIVGSTQFRWVPPTGFVSLWDDPIQNLETVITPAILLGVISAASVARMTRGAMLDVLGRDYVRTAKAKGLRPRRIIGRHVFRNASIPVLTVLGVETGRMLGGAVMTETIFSLPGLGRLVVDSIGKRDFPMVQGAVLVIAAMFIAVNLMTDILYGLADPRVRVGRGRSN